MKKFPSKPALIAMVLAAGMLVMSSASAHSAFTSNWNSPSPWMSAGNCSVQAAGGYSSGNPAQSWAWSQTDGGWCDMLGVTMGYRSVRIHDASGSHYYYGTGWKFTGNTNVSWWQGPPVLGNGLTPTVTTHYMVENGSAQINSHIY